MGAKRKISLMLVTILLLQIILPVASVIWESGITIISRAGTSGDWEYAIVYNTDWIEIIGYTGSETHLEIPSKIDGFSVYGIGDNAFEGCSSLTSVTIPDCITAIFSEAFKDCINLKSVEGDRFDVIYSRAFENCRSLTTMKVNEIYTINGSAFKGCSSLKNITITNNDESLYVTDENGLLFNSDKTELVRCPAGKQYTQFEIPSTVTDIGEYAFEGCSSLTNITIPNSVTSLDRGMFSGCSSLTSIGGINKVTSIGKSTFEGCSSLTSITIPSTVTDIEYYAFKGCSSLTEITIPNSVTSLSFNAFSGCSSLKKLIIPESVQYTDLGASELSDCSSLESIEVKSNKTSYYSEDGVLFNNHFGLMCYPPAKKDEKYTIPEGVYRINLNSLANANFLKEIDINDVCEYTKSDAFSDLLKGDIFEGCENLEKITVSEDNEYYSSDNGVLFNKDKTELICYPKGKKDSEYSIPNSVTSIQNGTLTSCSNLKSITVESDNKYYSSKNGVLFNKAGTKLVRYPGGKGNLYIIPKETKEIGSAAFAYCSNLTNILILEGIEVIWNSAFYGCSSLKSVEIPTSVTRIATEAFSGCSSLTSVSIPKDMIKIESNILSNCSSSLKIYCASNSIAYQYAKDNGLYYVIDDYEPTITATINPSSGYAKSKEITINAEDKGGSGLATQAYSFDGGKTWQTSPKKTYYKNEDEVIIQTKDKVGNITEAKVRVSKVIELTGISIESYPTKTTYKSGETLDTTGLKLKATYNDGTTATIEKEFICSPTKLDKVGKQTITVTYGEKTATFEVTVEAKDQEGPTITVSGNPTSWTKNNVTLTVSAQDLGVGLADKPYSFDGGEWQTGNTATFSTNKSVKIQVKDKAGNISEQTVNITKIDKTVPTFDVSGNPSSWTKNNVTLKIENSNDTGAGLADKPYSFDGGTTWQTGNTATFSTNKSVKIQVKDKAGNISEQTVNITKIDKTVPTFDVSGNPSSWTKNNVTLTITAQDTPAGLADKPYSFDGGTTWQSGNTKTFSENQTVKIKVKDAAGNVNEKTVKITKIDKTAPTFTTSGNPSSWTNKDVIITLTAYDTGAGLADNPYSFDGGKTWQSGNTKTFSENQTVKIKVKDKLDNISEEQTVEITKIDKTAPTINNISGNPTEWTKGTVTLVVNAQDTDGGLADAAYSFDGGNTWQSGNTKTFSENKTVKIKVKDKAGNISEQTIEITKLDNKVPSVIVSRSSFNFVSEPVTITLIAEDKECGLPEKPYSFDGGTTWQSEYTKTFSENQSVSMKVRDNLGNIWEHTTNITIIKEEATDENGITWWYTLLDGKAIEVSYKDGELGEVVEIPSHLDGYPVVSLKNSAGEKSIFADAESGDIQTSRDMLRRLVGTTGRREVSSMNSYESSLNIRKIIIPDTVTTIGNNAFELCTKLEEVVMNDNVTNIEDYAFFGCKRLEDIEVANNLSIGKYAFACCDNLCSMALGNGVSISENAFFESNNITLITESYTSRVVVYAVANNINYSIDNTWPTITKIEANPASEEGKIEVIVEAIDTGAGIARKGYSFDGGATWQESNRYICNDVAQLNIRVKDKLGHVTASGRKLATIEIVQTPNKTVYIEGENFNTDGMKIIAEYEGGEREEIQNYTVDEWEDLKLGQTSVNIKYTEEGITKEITQEIIVNKKKLDSIYVEKEPNKTRYLVGENFNEEGMKVFKKYDNQKSEEITNYTIVEKENLELGRTSVIIKYEEDGIEKETQQGIRVEGKEEDRNGITWKYTVIEGKAVDVYYESGELGEEVEIPSQLGGYPVVSLRNIEEEGNIFLKAENEEKETTAEMLERRELDGTPTIYTYESSLNIRKVIIPDTVETIGRNAFELCTNLEEVVMNENVKNIENYAFIGCKNLEKIDISNIENIGKYAFAYCRDLEKVTILNTEIEIKEKAFEESNGLKIYGTNGSKAQEYATANNITYAFLELDSIEIAKAPDKTKYQKGEELNTEGLIVRTIYNSGYTEEVTEGYTCSPTMVGEEETQEITVEYEGKTATFEITVQEGLYIDLGAYEEETEGENKYIKAINIGTTISEVLGNIETNGEKKIYKGEVEETDQSKKIATGMELRITLNDQVVSYKVIVVGDTDGNREADFNDILQINAHRLGKRALVGEYLKAADVNKDGQADFKDILQINAYRLGKPNSL